MSVFSNFRNKKTDKVAYAPSNPGSIKEINSLTLTESNKSKVENTKSSNFNFGGKDVGVDHPFDWELLESAYLTTPIIQGAIDKHVDFVMGGDYGVMSDKESILRRYKEFTAEQDFDTKLRVVVRNTLIFGSGFMEVVWRAGNVDQLKVIDSKSMYVRRDDKGKLLGYTQVVPGKSMGSAELVLFKPDEIIHFSFNNTGSSPYGTSIMRSLFGEGVSSTIKQYLETNIANTQLLKKQVSGKLHIQVGDKDNHPTQEDIDDLTRKLEQSKNNTEWVTSFLVKMNVLGYEGKSLDMTPFINYTEDQMVCGLQTPQVLLGKGNVNEGLANIQMEGFEYRVKSIQSFIGTGLENNLFDKMFGIGKYHFVWGRRVKKELDELNILIRFLAEKFVLSNDTRLTIENRIRTILGGKPLMIDEYKEDIDDMNEKKMNVKKSMNPLSNPVGNEEDDGVDNGERRGD